MTNLIYTGQDKDWPAIPRFAKKPNEWYFTCQNLVRSTIAKYSYLLGFQMTYNILNHYRRSYADESKAESFFFRYDVKNHFIEKDDIYYQALDIVTEMFRPLWPIHPIHFTDLRWYPWNLSANVERPLSHNEKLKKLLQSLKSRGIIDNARMSFHNLYNFIFVYSRQYIHKVKDGEHVPLHAIDLHVKPALVNFDEPDKVRTVFGVPKPLIFAEAMWFIPLFSHYFTHKRTPLLWNYEILNGGWYRLNYEYDQRWRGFKTMFNLDWSEFDMRVYFDMWKDCRSRTKTYFCFCGCYCPTRTYPHSRTTPTRLLNLWNWIEHAYFNLACVTTLGKRFMRIFAGMISGIFCTQFFDTYYNGVATVSILLEMGKPVTPDWFIKLMGDDVLFGLLQTIPISEWASFLEDFARIAERRFGMKLNLNKCGASQGINGATMLSYTNHNGYPARDIERLLAQLLHPKSLKDTPSRLMARSIGIYVASAAHPAVRQICEHIYLELKSQGFNPNTKGLSGLFDPNLNLDIPLDHFPTQLEVSARLSRPSERNPSLQDKYWDRTHFLEEAGCSRDCSVHPIRD
jgi:hypothetical protein